MLTNKGTDWSRHLACGTDSFYPPVLGNMLDALDAAADGCDNGITLIGERPRDPDCFRSYASIRDNARRMAGALAARGVTPGSRIVMVLPTCHEFVESFLACQMVGAIPVPVYPPAGRRYEAGLHRLVQITSHCRASTIITNKRLRPNLGDLALSVSRVRQMVCVEDLASGDPLDVPHPCRGDDVAFIQYTSGSTGNPKGTVITQRALMANLHSKSRALDVTPDDVYVSWCPLYHDMGLVGAMLFSINARIPFVLMSPTSFLAKPIRWLRAIQDYRGTLSAAPNFAFALCCRRVKPEERDGLDLSSWRVALNGAEPVLSETCQAFQATYGAHGLRPETMMPVYGMAEVTVAAALSGIDELPRFDRVDRAAMATGRAVPSDADDALSFACVGRAVVGQTIVIADDWGNSLPDRNVGHIVIESNSMMSGYLDNQEATDHALRDGRLWTGDVGYMIEGELYVTGRVKDLIIVNGRNYYAEDFELAAETVRGVRAGCSVAFGSYDEQRSAERVVLVCETRATDEAERAALIEEIHAALQARTELTVHEVVLAEPGTVPKTSSGKRRRRETAQSYGEGNLRAPRLGALRMSWLWTRSRIGMLSLGARSLFGGRPESAEATAAA